MAGQAPAERGAPGGIPAWRREWGLTMTSDRLETAATGAKALPVTPSLDPSQDPAIRRELVRLAWPAILEMVLNMGVWMADVAMVGRLGANALSVTGVSGQLYWSLMFLVGGIGVAVTALVSRRVGAGERDEAARVGSQGIMVAFFSGVAVMALIWSAAPGIFALTRLGPQIAPTGVVYLRTVCLAAPFVVTGMAFSGVLRGFGDTRTPMYITAFVNVLNIALGFSLIYGKLGLPALGVRGSAIAAATAQTSGALLFLGLILSRKVRAHIDLGAIFRPDRVEIGRILRLAVPASLESFFVDMARTVGVFAITSLGALSMAAYEVTAATESLSFMPGIGFATATAIIVGQSLGAGDRAKAQAGVRHGMILGLTFMGGLGVVFLLIPGLMVRVFTDDPAIIALASKCLRVTAFAQPLMCLEAILAGALRGAGDTRSPMIIGGITSWFCRVTLTYLAVFVFHLSLPWVWGVMVLDWGLKALWLGAVYRRGRWLEVKV